MIVFFLECVYDCELVIYVFEEFVFFEGICFMVFVLELGFVGQMLLEIVEVWSQDFVMIYLEFIEVVQFYDGLELFIEFILGMLMSIEDIDILLQWFYMNLCIDGGLCD